MKKLFILSLLSVGFIIIASEKPHGQKRPAESEAASSEKKPFVPSSYPYPFAPKSGPSDHPTLASSTVQQPTSQVKPSQSSSSSSSQQTQQSSSSQDLRWSNGAIVNLQSLKVRVTEEYNPLKGIHEQMKDINDIKLLKNLYSGAKHNIKIFRDFMLKEKENLQKSLNNIENNLENANKALNELPGIVHKKANQLLEEQKNLAVELGRPRTPEPKPKE